MTSLTTLRGRLGAAALALAVVSTAGTAFAAQTTSAAQPAKTQATQVAASTTPATKQPALHKTMTTSKATQCSDQAHGKGLTGAKYASFVQSCSSKS